MISGIWNFLRVLFRPTKSDLRFICEFFAAIQNEVAHDLYQLKIAEIDCNKCPSLPRPAKWAVIYSKHPKIFTAMDSIFSASWVFLGVVFFFAEHFRFSSVLCGKVDPDPKGQAFAFSRRCVDLVSSNISTSIQTQLVTFPWLKIDSGFGCEAKLDAGLLLKRSTASRILALSILSHIISIKSIYSRRFFFQSYTAWRWYYARLLLVDLPGPFLTADHFDRWAVLADKVVGERNKRYGKQAFTLLQHGSVNAQTQDVSIGFYIPTKLCNVTDVYLYSDADYKVFLNDILCTKKHKPALNYLVPKLKLSPVDNRGKFSLLVVGHPLCENVHVDFINWLSDCHDVYVLYKPHPLAKESRLISATGCRIVHDKQFYPRVDLVVSYPSTLVTEYNISGVEVFEHKMKPTPSEYDDLKVCVSDFILSATHVNL